MNRTELVSHLDTLLQTANIKDFSCNGLQIEGTSEVKKIALAVDACMQTYKEAVEQNCDMILVHHGFIWGGLKSITGSTHTQIQYLIKNNLSVYASHLPLDMNPEYGNNIALAKILELENIEPFGVYDGVEIGFAGTLKNEMNTEEISKKLQTELKGQSHVLPFGKDKNTTVAIVSGAGSKVIPEAISKNIDCFITGESAHQDHHLALEGQINVIYAGHYHTEQHGVMALGKYIEKTFGVETVYLDQPTLV